MKDLARTWIVLASIVTLGALLNGCGGEDPALDGCSDTAPEEDVPAPDGGREGNAPPSQNVPPADSDGGSDVPPTGDAGAPSSDAGTGGTGSTPDAGGGGSAPDAGSAPDSGTGGSSPDAGGSGGDGGSADAGSTPTSAAPLRTPSANHLEFASVYVGGSACGEVRGNMPGMNWSAGLAANDTNSDGYLELTFGSIAAGTYEVSYLALACGTGAPGSWANFGSSATLLGMSPAARAFVNCTWWNPVTETTSPGGSCNLRLAVAAGGVITAAGNMQNYHE